MYVAPYRKKAAKKGKLPIPNFPGLVILYGAKNVCAPATAIELPPVAG